MTGSDGDLLESWKEIAAFLNRDVKTVRRWEKREGLPVHRHRHHALDTVYAFRSEIEVWRKGRRVVSPFSDPHAPARPLLVGRTSELAFARGLFAHACEGSRQTLFVTGELGIGKTAFVETLARDVADTAWTTLGQSIPLHGPAHPYLPVIEALSRLCQRRDGRRLRDILLRYAPSWTDLLPLAPDASVRPSPAHVDIGDDDTRRERFALELIGGLEALGRERPLVLVVEDLHWGDNSTIELLARLAQRTEPARLLVVGTYRAGGTFEEHSYLRGVCGELKAHFQAEELPLRPLAVTDIEEYLTSAFGRWADSRAAAEFVARRTEGNPLFIVHLMRHLVACKQVHSDERGLAIGLSGTETVPPTLCGVIEYDIDQLSGTERRVLDAASVVGRSFTDRMVACVAEEVEIHAATSLLERLAVCGRLVKAEGHDGSTGDGARDARFAFLHQFYRDVLYDQISAARKAALHRRVAELIEATAVGTPAPPASEIAVHYERAGEYRRAAASFAAAAEAALRLNADAEAEACTRRGMAAAEKLPPGVDRSRLELRLRLTLCTALGTVRSWADPSVEEAYRDVIALSSTLPNCAELVPALLGIARYEQFRGRMRESRQAIDRAMHIAAAGHSGLLGMVRLHAAIEAFMTADYARAIAVAEEECSKRLPADCVTSQGFDNSVALLNTLSWSRCMVGQAQAANLTAQEELATAKASGHLQTIAFAEAWTAPIFEWLGASTDPVELVESALAVAVRHKLQTVLWWATGVKGWLIARRGRPELGAETLATVIASQREAGMLAFLSCHLAWLAEALLLGERADTALSAIDEGLELCRSSGMRLCEPELLRLRGEALAIERWRRSSLRTAPVAESAFREAIAVARQHSARFLELRAAIGLSRLLRSEGHCGDALDEMRAICSGWAPDDQVPELHAAHGLLRELTESERSRLDRRQ